MLGVAQFSVALAVGAGMVLPANAYKAANVIRVDNSAYASGGSMNDVTRRANDIIASNNALKVASTVCEISESGGSNGSDSSSVVADYGRSLKDALPYIIRQDILFDADTLPYDKAIIKSALVECTNQSSLTESELASLGDLYFYLSYFIVGLDQQEAEPERDMFEEQRVEGLALRSEWKSAIARRPRSKISQFIARWVKPNA